MRTTICIPVYNQADTLAKTIESALTQTVPCEIIVVNDGSTDASKFVAMEYEDRGVKLINQINKGLSSARNTGIMNATGEFFLPLDSDDTLEPTCVERIEKVFDETDADVVSPSFTTFGEDNQTVTLSMRPSLDDFKTANRVGYCSAVKLSVLKQVGGYSPRMIWGYEDYALWFDLLLRGKKIYTIPESLWNYRVRQNSMMTTARLNHDKLMTQISKDHPGLF